MDIGAVNFEDLFDFSPEPLEDKQQHRQPEEPSEETVVAVAAQAEEEDQRHRLQPLLSQSLPNSSSSKGKRGRKPGQKNLKTDMKSKLERSRQSARECRARKKLRYQYLDDLILEREKANMALRDELLKYQRWCHELDKGWVPDDLREMLAQFKEEKKVAGSV